jgi:hypothetical protein
MSQQCCSKQGKVIMSDHESVNLLKRKLLKTVAAGAAFGVPFMASFSKDGLRVSSARANHNDNSPDGHGTGGGSKKGGGKKGGGKKK